MPPLTLEGNTLGEKHKNFNELVQNTLDNNQINLSKINNDDSDIENLLRIDMANKTRDVEYIVEVLKCDDMLFVSRAIKQSIWLVTEQEYTHIISPEYLFTELFPYMLTKAINKFLLHIRLHLKDEKRVESFYKYIKNIDKDAHKWLLNCSETFIEKVIQNEASISLHLYKRLCKRSIKFLQYYSKVTKGYSPEKRALETVLFLLKSNTEEYLNILDKIGENSLPSLGKKHTEIVMKKYPNKILDNFEKYISEVDLSIVAKYLKKKDIQNFLIKYTNNKKTKYYFSNYENLKYFIMNMQPEDKFQFVKKSFIDKSPLTELTPEQTGELCAVTADALPQCPGNTYRWYQYAPFSVAFVELKKLIRAESSPTERCAIMSVLITCAKKNPQNLNILLQYYHDKHRNEPFKFKIQFVNEVIRKVTTHNLDSESWEVLDKLFNTLEVYIESDNEVQSCLKSIILYKVVRGEIVPEIVEKKFRFETFKNIQKTLNKTEQDKLFTYLLNLLSAKIKCKIITSESDLENTINLMEDMLNLIKDWKKPIENFPFILNKIQELLTIKKQNSWKTNFSLLYNVEKSYRKHMFRESITLCPGEEVCINALKYDPALLTRYNDVVATLRADDTISLRRLLTKLRVYWPHSLAQQWADAYLRQMDNSTGHKATVLGLFTLLPRNQIIAIAKDYVPAESKINWIELDQMKFSFQKNIARNLCKSRPIIPLDVVLWYAHGDYLQFAVPSLNTVSYNLSKEKSGDYISKLLNAPVSLQKYGLYLAYTKLNYDELKPIFSDIWQSTKNTTIRTHIFTYIYNILCRVKDTVIATELWALLNKFIDDLATDENKVIFNKLGNAKKVHPCVQAQYFMKSFQYLTSLPTATNCKTYVNNLLTYAPNIMDILDDHFVIDKMLSPIKEIISKPRCEFINIMSSYVLHGRTEEQQCERFRKVLVPALEHAFLLWNSVKDRNNVRENVDMLLQALTWDLRKYLCFNKIVVPIKLFTEIKVLIEQKLTSKDNYLTLTTWALTCEYVKLVDDYKNMFYAITLQNTTLADHQHYLPPHIEEIWKAWHIKISQSMGPAIVKLLKEDSKRYFPTICHLFSTALDRYFNNLMISSTLIILETLKYMVVNEDFVPSYLVVCDLIAVYCRDDEDLKKREEVCDILSTHTSLEVQMHYQRTLYNIR